MIVLRGCTPGCSRSNLGSNPGILPDIAHKVKIRDGERTLLDPGNKKSKKTNKKISNINGERGDLYFVVRKQPIRLGLNAVFKVVGRISISDMNLYATCHNLIK